MIKILMRKHRLNQAALNPSDDASRQEYELACQRDRAQDDAYHGGGINELPGGVVVINGVEIPVNAMMELRELGVPLSTISSGDLKFILDNLLDDGELVEDEEGVTMQDRLTLTEDEKKTREERKERKMNAHKRGALGGWFDDAPDKSIRITGFETGCVASIDPPRFDDDGEEIQLWPAFTPYRSPVKSMQLSLSG